MQMVLWVGCVVRNRLRSWFGSDSQRLTVSYLKDTSEYKIHWITLGYIR